MGFDSPLFFASFTRNIAGVLILLLPLWLLGKWQQMSWRDWFFWLSMRSSGGILGFVGFYYGLLLSADGDGLFHLLRWFDDHGFSVRSFVFW